MTDFTELLDLASARVGGRVLAANDEFFAPKENLLKPEEPVFLPGEYTDRGKWMDGWETRRRREPGHDWCLVRLGLPGSIAGVVVDTRHFKGNFPESCSLEACALEGDPGAEQVLREAAWTEIVSQSILRGDSENPLAVGDARSFFTHLRLNIFPDGGVARLRVYGRAHPDRARLAAAGEVDLAAAENGALVVAASDMFFGSRHNLILPGAPQGMHDGWETRRRRGPGHDWAIVRLGLPGVIRRASVDTTHFKGNAPGSCSIEVSDAPEETDVSALSSEGKLWRELLPRVTLRPHAVHELGEELRKDAGRATHARLNIYPDGGVARLRLWGTVAPE